MIDLFDEVQPGELITAERMNLLLKEVKGLKDALGSLQGTVVGGPSVVPSVFGNKLSDAKLIFAQPTIKLNVGVVIDALGTVVNSSLADAQPRVIIGQSPPPGARVAVGTPVNLVLAALASAVGGGTGGPKAPVIDGFSNTETKIGAPVTILGKNFDPVRSNNKVTFAGVDAGTPTIDSSEEALFVTVPTVPGIPPKKSVEVKVTVLTTGLSGTRGHVVDAPLAQPRPAIDTSQTSTTVVTGGEMTVKGSNFSSTPANNKVVFNGTIEVSPKAGAGTSTPDTIIVVVPTADKFSFGGAPGIGGTVFVKRGEGAENKSDSVGIFILNSQ